MTAVNDCVLQSLQIESSSGAKATDFPRTTWCRTVQSM